MVDLNKSLDALEGIVLNNNANNVLFTKKENISEIYRMGLTKTEHAKVLLLASLIAKRYNRHIGNVLPSENLNKAFKRSKVLNSSIFYKMGLVIFVLIVLQFKLSLMTILLTSILILGYCLALFYLIKTEKHIYKYISKLASSMGDDLLKKEVNMPELIYEIVRTKDSEKNRLIKIKLKDIYKKHIKDCSKKNKNKKIKLYLTYDELLSLYKTDLHKRSIASEDFIFRIILEEIYSYRALLEKKKIK